MATAHTDISAPVFGPQNEQVLSIQERRQSSEVFARERTSTAASDRGIHGVKVLILIGSESIELMYWGPSLPAWAEPVLRSLPERWGRGLAWDSYGAVPTRLHLVIRLLNALSAVLPDDLAELPQRDQGSIRVTTPQITALSDGGVQAEWHGFGGDLEIVVADGEAPSYYFFSHATNEEEDNALEGNEPRVRELIRGLR
jgi:hypothetical protein